MKEGVVIDLTSPGRRFRPASKHGLPFVAFTRSESFAMTAFKNLPPWQDFVDGRNSDMLRMRKNFIATLEAMHTDTLKKHSTLKSKADEDKAFEEWQKAKDASAKRRKKAGPVRRCPKCDELWGEQ